LHRSPQTQIWTHLCRFVQIRTDVIQIPTDLDRSARICEELYRCESICTDCADLYRSLQISADLHRFAQICPDFCRSVQICADLYISVRYSSARICPDL